MVALRSPYMKQRGKRKSPHSSSETATNRRIFTATTLDLLYYSIISVENITSSSCFISTFQ